MLLSGVKVSFLALVFTLIFLKKELNFVVCFIICLSVCSYLILTINLIFKYVFYDKPINGWVWYLLILIMFVLSEITFNMMVLDMWSVPILVKIVIKYEPLMALVWYTYRHVMTDCTFSKLYQLDSI